GSSFSVRKGGRVDMPGLQRFLVDNGYSRTETVREAGEYALRGGIIDLFPAGFERPVRMDLFGDEVESIKAFDAVSQRSEGEIPEFSLQPATEFFLSDEGISHFRRRYLEEFGVARQGDPLYEAVSEGRRYNGMEHWLPLFHARLDTLFEYAPSAAITMDYHAAEAAHERVLQVQDFYDTRKTLQDAAKKKKAGDESIAAAIYNPLPPAALYLGEGEWAGQAMEAEVLSPFAPPQEDGHVEARKSRDFADIRTLPDGDVFGELRKHLAGLSQKKVISAFSEGSAARLKTLLENAGIKPVVSVKGADDLKKLKPHETGLAILGLEHGFTADDLAVLTEADILGERLGRNTTGKKKKAENFLREVSALNEGDLVVHIDHGIGKFVALETVKAAGVLHDCLKLEYAGGDKLFIPVENLEVLSRFGSDEGTVQLDKLGGAGWQARKARVKKNLMEIADHLLGIAAARKLKQAPKLDVSADIYHQFAARFPYAETEDQERAITDTLAGLAGDYPMDRLICGDVGFGKTEVAIRAAYVAAMSGAQVALIVPTTLLAR
ncbi:MAG TPA: CarD family transcriptional regulator, partial [Alphaproteobacteria bacterium]|nr:CarD family transcriptional regulator [Alphaproteobacteria bacterium]